MADDRQAKCLRFITARASAKQLCPTMDLIPGWFPALKGELVNCGSALPTPSGGFKTRADAVAAARTFKQLCRDWLAKNTNPNAGEANG